jgi:hypothetical protein
MFRIGKGTARLDSGLGTIQTGAQGLQLQVAEKRAQVTALRVGLPLWLDLASVAATLLLLWLLFSQVIVFVFGLSVYRGENLFARWLGPSTGVLPEEPAPQGALASE